MEQLHECNIVDDDHHFIIDPVSRTIRNSAIDADDYYGRPTLICGDKNSERFTFEIPLEIEGHNMSECDRVEIHYINIDSTGENQSPDIYEATDVTVDNDRVIFSWLISSNATKYIGTLSFAVKFLCFTTEIEDGAEIKPGDIEYAWNTKPFTGANIDEGYDNKATIVDEYVDILQEWYNRFETRLDDNVLKMSVVDKMTLDNPNATKDRPFSESLYRRLLERERVYMEKSEEDGAGLSPMYVFTGNADIYYNPYGYASLNDLCNDWGLDITKVKAGTEYVVVTENSKTSYHPRMFTAAARMQDGSVRGRIDDSSDSSTLVNKQFLTGKLGLKIDKNAISSSSTTPYYDHPKVLIRGAKGGAYGGVPIGIHSVKGANSIPRFSADGELNGYTDDESPSTALVNKSYAKALDTKVLNTAKSHAETAESNAKSHAETVASAAETNAKSYAETVASTAETNAKSYADEKASAAESNAMEYADVTASTAEINAKLYAEGEINAAKEELRMHADSSAMYAADKAKEAAKKYAESYTDKAIINNIDYSNIKNKPAAFPAQRSQTYVGTTNGTYVWGPGVYCVLVIFKHVNLGSNFASTFTVCINDAITCEIQTPEDTSGIHLSVTADGTGNYIFTAKGSILEGNLPLYVVEHMIIIRTVSIDFSPRGEIS